MLRCGNSFAQRELAVADRSALTVLSGHCYTAKSPSRKVSDQPPPVDP
jgi:hypothetical protein